MKNVIPIFKRPLKSKDEPRTDVGYWDKAMDAFDAKEYRKTIIETINYMNSTLLWGKETGGDIEILQGQGSAQIQVNLTSDTFTVKAPFLKVTASTNKVALFRKVAEINFNPLTLSQIHLKDDTLWFDYEMPVSLAQPNKIYDVIREICVFADDYDDEFVEKYKADFYQEPKVTQLTEDEKEKVWQQIDTILTEWKNYVSFFKEKRWDAFQWDITVISILKIVNMPYVHGNLRTKLQEYVNNLFNGKIDFNHRIDKGVNFMNKLCAKTKEEYMKDIYHAEAFVSLKWRSSTQILQDDAKNMERNVAKYVKDGDNFMLCYYLQYSFLYILYNFNVEEAHKDAIYDVLEEVSGKEHHIAGPKLLKTYYNFLDGNTKIVNKKGTKKGLFAKLFG